MLEKKRAVEEYLSGTKNKYLERLEKKKKLDKQREAKKLEELLVKSNLVVKEEIKSKLHSVNITTISVEGEEDGQKENADGEVVQPVVEDEKPHQNPFLIPFEDEEDKAKKEQKSLAKIFK